MLTDEEIKSRMKQAYEARGDDETRISAMIKGCRAVIEANNAKVLADLKPDYTTSLCFECGEPQLPTTSGMTCHNGHGGARGAGVRSYSSGKVSALIQRNEELEARVKELFFASPREWQELAVTDGMAIAFHRALTDATGRDELEDIKSGLRAAFVNSLQPREWEDLWPPALTDLMKEVDAVITQHPEFDKSQREWVTYIKISAALRAKNGG